MMKKLLLTAALISVASGAAFAMGPGGGQGKGQGQQGGSGDRFMSRIDTDGDGQISKVEFMAKHEEKFAEMDANKDGVLTKEEMQAARSQMKEKRDEMRKSHGMKGDGQGKGKGQGKRWSDDDSYDD